MNLLLAELPETGYLIIAAVVLAIIALVGLGVILRTAQSLREGVARELRSEIENLQRPTPVEVQTPLVVTPHAKFTTQEEHEALQAKMEDEFKRERSSRKAIYEKVESQGQAIARLQTETTQQTRQLSSLDAKMDQVLLRLPRNTS